MRIDDLQREGFSRRIIDCWRADGLEYLLPLQQEAIQSYGLLKGENLLISGPTSSGKTFCGELAAIKTVQNNTKAVYLVPLKALAAEKYNEFKKRYRKAGLNVIVVSSDYRENKRQFEKGEFDIAIVVYEMLNSLTVTGLAALESVGTVILDELQLIGTSDRGVAYEAAIARIRNLRRKVQIIGLIGGLDKCGLFEKWLGLPLLKANNRPVELYRGVLFNGRFSYKRFNDCHEAIEYFSNNNAAGDKIDIEEKPAELFEAVRYLVATDEQVLIFVSSRNSCHDLASKLSGYLSLPSAEITLNQLSDLPDTLQKAALIECLKHGVGFHNADLNLTYRKLIEDSFRSGEIRAMVCTTTLALGVNLPSKNVFIEPAKYYDSFNGQPILKPLLMDDYNQIAGRAGRFGKGDDFGRAIIIAGDEGNRERIRETYINRSAEPMIHLFDTEKLAGLALSLISCGLIKDYNDTRDLLKSSLRGYREGFQNNVPTTIIDFLNMHGFITLKGCRLICTDLGKAAAGHNIELNTAAAIKEGFAKYKLADSFLSWLFYLTDISECRRELLPYKSSRYFDYYDREFIDELLRKYEESARGPLIALVDDSANEIKPSRIKTMTLLADMIQPIPTIELETKYNAGWGRLKHIGEFYSNVLGAVADIGASMGLNKEQKTKLAIYADCLYHGLPESGLILARFKVPMLERDFILRLNQMEIYSPADIVNAGFDQISNIIPESIAKGLYDESLKREADSTKTDDAKPIENKRPLRAKKIGARYEVIINDTTIYLQPRLYTYLHKLYNADHPDGWLNKSFLDSGNNQVKYIYKLRQALKQIDGARLESDGAGRYRLLLTSFKRPPQGIEATG